MNSHRIHDESANWLGIMSRFVSYVCPLAHRPRTWAIGCAGWDGSTHVSSAMAMARMAGEKWDKKCQEAHMSEKIGRSVVNMANSKCRFKWKIFNPVPKKSQQKKGIVLPSNQVSLADRIEHIYFSGTRHGRCQPKLASGKATTHRVRRAWECRYYMILPSLELT